MRTCFARTVWRSVLLAAALCAGACDRFPRDAGSTLDKALNRGSLRVGVVANEPWVKGQEGQTPQGVEPRLLRELAAELGLEPVWRWGGLEETLQALNAGELDVVAAGLADDSPWRKRVAFTVPYYTSESWVGAPSGEKLPAELEGVQVAILSGQGLSKPLRQRGATPVERDSLQGVSGPVAAEAWKLAALGLRESSHKLHERPHVMAVAQGESAMLMRLEAFLLRPAIKLRVEEALAATAEP